MSSVSHCRGSFLREDIFYTDINCKLSVRGEIAASESDFISYGPQYLPVPK